MFNFNNTTSATATVPAVNLTLPASPTKQILVFVPVDASTLSLTINGVASEKLIAGGEDLPTLRAFSVFYAGSGPFDVVVTRSAASTTIAAIEVYEIDGAKPLHEAYRTSVVAPNSTLSQSVPVRAYKGSVAAACAWMLTDTVTATWTGLTEKSDADVGNFRLSAADELVRRVNTETIASNFTQSASSIKEIVLLCPVPSDCLLSGGLKIRISPTISTSILTIVAERTNNTGQGSGKLVLMFGYLANVAVTGVTYNGVPMTQIGSAINLTSTPDLYLYAYSIDFSQVNPSGDIVITFASALSSVEIFVNIYTLYGVNNFSAAQSVTGNGTGNNVSVNCVKDSYILAQHIRNSSNANITWTGALKTTTTNATLRSESSAVYPFADAETNRAVGASAAASDYATLVIVANP